MPKIPASKKTVPGFGYGFRHWSGHQYYYAANLPGEEGVDWGYVTKSEDARPLSPDQQTAFLQNCADVYCEDYGIVCYPDLPTWGDPAVHPYFED